MKETDVAAFVQLLGKDKEFVEDQIEDGSLCARVKDYLDSNKFFTKEDFTKYETNTVKEIREAYDKELVAKAKAGELDHALFGVVKGATLEQKEKELAKTYGIESYKNLDDLIAQVIKSKSGETNDEVSKTLQAKVDELKDANLKLQKEKDEAVSSAKDKYKKTFLNSELEKAVSGLPFDLGDKSPEEQKEALANMTDIIKSVFTSKYSLDTDENYEVITVSSPEGILKHDATKDPLGVKDVLISLTQKYGYKLKSPELGGQGGSSSQGSKSLTATTLKELDEKIAKGEIDGWSKDAMEQRQKLIVAGKKE